MIMFDVVYVILIIITIIVSSVLLKLMFLLQMAAIGFQVVNIYFLKHRFLVKSACVKGSYEDLS